MVWSLLLCITGFCNDRIQKRQPHLFRAATLVISAWQAVQEEFVFCCFISSSFVQSALKVHSVQEVLSLIYRFRRSRLRMYRFSIAANEPSSWYTISASLKASAISFVFVKDPPFFSILLGTLQSWHYIISFRMSKNNGPCRNVSSDR